MSRSRWRLFVFLGLLLLWASAHVQLGMAQDDPVKARAESGAEKVRKALDQAMVLDFAGNSLEDALDHLKTKTGVNFVVDRYALSLMGAIDDGMGGAAPAALVHLKCDKSGKVRTALQRTLNSFALTYVVIDDSVLITTEELGIYRVMRQRVSVAVKDEPLRDALKDLARTTGLNLVLDPRQIKAAQAPVSLDLEDATLETAVKLLAEMGNLKAVRMGNVMFVTDEERAKKIRKEEDGTKRNPMVDGVGPGILPGIGLGGMGGGGVIGRAIEAVPGVAPAMPDAPPAPAEKIEP